MTREYRLDQIKSTLTHRSLGNVRLGPQYNIEEKFERGMKLVGGMCLVFVELLRGNDRKD